MPTPRPSPALTLLLMRHLQTGTARPAPTIARGAPVPAPAPATGYPHLRFSPGVVESVVTVSSTWRADGKPHRISLTIPRADCTPDLLADLESLAARRDRGELTLLR